MVLKKPPDCPLACGGVIETMHFYRNRRTVLASDGGGHNLFGLKEIEKGVKNLLSKNIENIEIFRA